ncbi:hypothetical protein IBTHAUMO2_500003 [Nitrosopumilaceae archaeon]|nr:hypothetical protein IBTHAUMO2_500003 [Nitrosopumilaceae archaeon]
MAGCGFCRNLDGACRYRGYAPGYVGGFACYLGGRIRRHP